MKIFHSLNNLYFNHLAEVKKYRNSATTVNKYFKLLIISKTC